MPTQAYNDPAGGSPSTVGSQFRTDHYIRTALTEARRLQYFMPLADVTGMPKNMGKKIKRYHYLPMLDDANINDQGIDADGVTITNVYEVFLPAETATLTFAEEADATAVAADTDGVKSGSVTPWTVTFPDPVSSVVVSSAVIAANVQEATEAAGSIVRQRSGNLYGSSRDVGVITSKLPTLSEHGGRVNRVGFKRKDIEGTIEKFGFFDEYTQESLDFDTDDQLQMHIHREMINGAHEITEAALQMDLLNSAGVIRYSGDATMTSELDQADTITYRDLLQLSIDLDNNRCPKQTKIISGTRMIDTKTIPGARIMYIGSELLPTLHAMKDLHTERAFVSVEKYAAGTQIMNGEVGSIGHFRFVVVPEMLKWQGAGADATSVTTHYETGGRFDVFPMLVVGEDSFTTIGFQTSGRTVKFTIYHKAPGKESADRSDPYGEKGFMSIKWYYGFLNQRPERLALYKTTAAM